MSTIDQQFVEFIVKSLVGNPDGVKIDRTIDEKGVLLELSVDQEDLGRVIGKRGATAQSIRTLLRALGTKNDARYKLKIVDPDQPPREEKKEEKPVTEEEEDTSEAAEEEAEEVEETEDMDASSDDDTSDDDDMDDDDDDDEEEEEMSMADKHRADLEDLDDLDI